ncbi:MAG: redoxin domain-containing protein [Labilithrix sp.]|nr:redoxin domain-containing protein [Labilithrix sp.]
MTPIDGKLPLVTSLLLALLAATPIAACGGASSPAAAVTVTSTTAPASLSLRDEAGKDESLSERASRAPLTVLLFFSSDCPVQKAHDARIRELVDAYGPRGVAFSAVVSEVGADVAAERAAAKQRGLGVPVLEDKDAALADALDVEYSTHAVVLDRERRVLYTGGIDSDRTHLSPKSSRWLANALDEALAGKPVSRAKTEPLGCPLRKH